MEGEGQNPGAAAKAPLSIKALQAMFEAQQEQFAAQEKTIADLQLQLASRKGTAIAEGAEKAKPTIPANLVKAQGKAYRWNLAHFVMPGTSIVYTAEEAAQSDDLIAEILKVPGQEVLKEQV